MTARSSRPIGIVARICLCGIACIAALAMLMLLIGSLLITADMSTDNPMQELILFRSDSLLRNIAVLVLAVLLGGTVMLLFRHIGLTGRLKPRILALSLGIWVTILGSLWVAMSLSTPTHDSYIVTSAGVAAANGDLSIILDRDYFIRFPFQLGYVFWTELWARLFSLTHEDYIALEIVNILCLAFGEAALVLTADKLFRNREITLAATLGLAFFFQPMIFSTFLYGTIPGFCFSAWSSYCFIRYLKEYRMRYLVASSVLLAVAVSLKLNNMILFAAMAILLAIQLLKEKPLRQLASLLILCAVVLTVPNIGKWQYELRTQKEFGDGIPMVSWMAMGLHDAETAPGWYNGYYTVTNYYNHNQDSAAAAKASLEVIRDRLGYLAEHPREGAVFFRDKILSQWSEPTYQSIWQNQVRGHSGDPWGLAPYVCGNGEHRVTSLMDHGVQFIFCGMLVSCVCLILQSAKKNRGEESLGTALYLIPLLFLGGFLYHALFEAKSQYVITYVIFMIPYAAYGFSKLCSAGKKLGTKLFQKKKST